MYTRCPECTTVFRVTADALRAAQGDVRCGVCSNTFNALENLSEAAHQPAPAANDDGPSPDDSMTVEELSEGESIELSTPDAPEAVEVNEELAMEFHGSAAEVERLFVIENAAPENIEPPVSDLDRTDEYPILVLDEQDVPEEIILESSELPPRAPPAAPAPTSAAAAAERFGSSSRILIPEEMRKRLIEEAAGRSAEADDFGMDGPVSTHRRWPWVAGVALALLLFGVQVVHSQREELVRDPGVGPWIARAYSAFGVALTSPTDLSAYELRQWGAANDPMQADRLLLRASIVNRAPYAQPMPLLRLTLQDRLGASLGERDVAPADYLPGSGQAKLMEPGQRVDAEIRVVDPGREAVGFEMDVCLPADGGVLCAHQVAAAAP